MRILGLPILEIFKKKYSDCRGQIDAWRAEVENEKWKDTMDVKRRYPSASFLGNGRIIFNIKGNSYRLVVQVRFIGEIVLIEWIGPHSEYDKKKF
jgi:mRNA interferase HigB